MKKILGELKEEVEQIGRLNNELVKAVETVEPKLTKAYRTKKNEKERETIWKETKKLEEILTKLNVPFEIRAGILINGFWARYHLIAKSYSNNKTAIQDLAFRAEHYYKAINEDMYPEISVAWGYLYATIIGELKGDQIQRKVINEEIYSLATTRGRFDLITKAIDSRVSEERSKENYLGAIKIADEFTRDLLDGAVKDPRAILNAANIINNGTLSRVNQSDLEEKTEKRIGLLVSAVMVGFDKAEKIYEEVIPPNLGHFNGLKNRLIMATIRILDAYGEEEPELGQELKDISQQIQSKFSAKNQWQAIEIIRKTAKNYPRGTLINVRTILERIDRFLETYQE